MSIEKSEKEFCCKGEEKNRAASGAGRISQEKIYIRWKKWPCAEGRCLAERSELNSMGQAERTVAAVTVSRPEGNGPCTERRTTARTQKKELQIT